VEPSVANNRGFRYQRLSTLLASPADPSGCTVAVEMNIEWLLQALAARGFSIDLPAREALPTAVIFNGQLTSKAALGTFDIFALLPDTELIPNRLLEAMDANGGSAGNCRRC
jgi:hypothetical protein